MSLDKALLLRGASAKHQCKIKEKRQHPWEKLHTSIGFGGNIQRVVWRHRAFTNARRTNILCSRPRRGGEGERISCQGGAAGEHERPGPDEGLLKALVSHRNGLKEAEVRTRELEADAGGWGDPPADLRHSAEVIEVSRRQRVPGTGCRTCGQADGPASRSG